MKECVNFDENVVMWFVYGWMWDEARCHGKGLLERALKKNTFASASKHLSWFVSQVIDQTGKYWE